MVNFLSSNLRYLRRRDTLSQQQLADDLGIKRSNIAAYETKNVEPRLALLDRMASYFSVSLTDLILTDLSRGGHRAVHTPPTAPSGLEEVREVLSQMRRAVEGFRVFYEFKREAAAGAAGGNRHDIDNFLVFIDHVAEYQRQIDRTLPPPLLSPADREGDALVGRRAR
jgi:transcriptional regulator with XRE-family HTH domain